ncbi:unnamed protein product [Ranitomeya imitator]|uniref:Uncharacterized protein n=1 Tax=Ranitomeya imitator TaxID=111125 RepID=A0ABN9MD12_9NEOB|nr:unnamed protein product [Ranitomeya imitator]
MSSSAHVVKYMWSETTQAIKDRISHHKSDIRCKKNHLPIPYHFNTAGHTIAQLRFWVLEQVNVGRRSGDLTKRLLAREAYWIHILQSMEPKGLNRDFDVTGYFMIFLSYYDTYLPLVPAMRDRPLHQPISSFVCVPQSVSQSTSSIPGIPMTHFRFCASQEYFTVECRRYRHT